MLPPLIYMYIYKCMASLSKLTVFWVHIHVPKYIYTCTMGTIVKYMWSTCIERIGNVVPWTPKAYHTTNIVHMYMYVLVHVKGLVCQHKFTFAHVLDSIARLFTFTFCLFISHSLHETSIHSWKQLSICFVQTTSIYVWTIAIFCFQFPLY